MRSAFTADGYRRERCGICAGSGQSTYRDSDWYARFQAKARAQVAEWGGLTPPTAPPA